MYSFGVILAIAAGTADAAGLLCQKSAVDRVGTASGGAAALFAAGVALALASSFILGRFGARAREGGRDGIEPAGFPGGR